jgi:hypothetical protein
VLPSRAADDGLIDVVALRCRTDVSRLGLSVECARSQSAFQKLPISADDVPSAKNGTGQTSCSNVLGSLPKSSDPVSSERSLSRKKTWAVETFVHCKNNPQQTMTSLSIGKNEVLLQGLIPWFERSRWIRAGSWGCDDCAWTLLPARFGSGNRLLELSQQRSRP